MNKPNNLPYYFEWSRQFPHIAAADLYGRDVSTEIAVMAIDGRNGDLYFIRLDHLDPIDIKRLKQIILSRDSARYALWDLMDQKTLANGVNALEFFNQFVMVRTVGGEIMKPGSGSRGLPSDFSYKGPAANGFVINDENGSPAKRDEPTSYADELDASDNHPVAIPARKAGRPRKS